MTSPFPGMDPYLEGHWRDVHATFVVHASAMLNRQIGADLRARMNERVIVENQRDEPARERFIEILDITAARRVVTVIEFVSPTNKLPGDGRDKYRRMRQEVIAEISFVEIDLTRSGTRELPCAHLEQPARTNTAYLTCVCHGGGGRQMDVYPTALCDRLPTIRIPLRPSDPHAVLDLKTLVDLAYDEGRCDDIDYVGQPVPPFAQEDAAWADQLLRAAGKR